MANEKIVVLMSTYNVCGGGGLKIFSIDSLLLF